MKIIPRQKLYINSLIANNYFNDDTGKNIKNFQSIFYKKFKLNQTIPLSRGRMGIYLAVKEIITKNKNEILICPFTIFDIINMIILAGGKPVFIDSEKNSNQTSLNIIKKNINAKTAGIIITHYEKPFHKILQLKKILKKKKIFLIEDCAINLGGKIKEKYIGAHGDFAIYSFGLYKFCSTLYGGALKINDRKIYKKLLDEIKLWPNCSVISLIPQIFKYFFIKFLTSRVIFNFFTFPVFKIANEYSINFITKFGDNDPNPIMRKSLPKNFFYTLSNYQINLLNDQFKQVENLRKLREKNFECYKKNLSINQKIAPKVNPCYINFPIIIKKKRDENLNYLIRKKIDSTKHFYKNCSKLKIFNRFKKKLSNLNKYVDSIIVLPTHPFVNEKYIKKVTKVIKEKKMDYEKII